MDRLLDRIDQWPRSYVWGISSLAILAVSIFDISTQIAVSLLLFYFFPIALLTWRINARAGQIASCVAALVWLYTSLLHLSPIYTLPIAIWNVVLRLLCFSVIVGLVAALKQLLDRERLAALHDTLTGLLNRRAFDARVQALHLATQCPCTMVYLDLDRFKQINDTSGHHTGDMVLVMVAATLRQHARATDIVARIGGDEFAMLLPRTTADIAAATLAQIHTEISALRIDGVENVSATVGMVTFMYAQITTEEMVRYADHVMYHGKRQQRGVLRHVIVDESDMQKIL